MYDLLKGYEEVKVAALLNHSKEIATSDLCLEAGVDPTGLSYNTKMKIIREKIEHGRSKNRK